MLIIQAFLWDCKLVNACMQEFQGLQLQKSKMLHSTNQFFLFCQNNAEIQVTLTDKLNTGRTTVPTRTAMLREIRRPPDPDWELGLLQ